VFQALYE
jgi:hypothetical protein